MNKTVVRAAIAAVCFFVAGASLFAWRWPLSETQSSGDFATQDRKVVRTGVDIHSAVDEVRAIQDGTVIFADTNRPGSRRMPVPMKAMIAIAHDDGIVSVYDGLQPDSVRQWFGVSGEQARVREGDVVATLQADRPMRLLVSDTKLSAWINPFLALPLLPDDRAPVISELGMMYAQQSEPVSLRDRMQVQSKDFTLQVSIRDVMGIRGQGQGLATVPYSIVVVWNGVVVYAHENIMLRKGGGRGLEYSKVRPESQSVSRRFLSGDLSLGLSCVDGLNRLEIRASDLAGNRVSAAYRMTFEPPEILPAVAKTGS